MPTEVLTRDMLADRLRMTREDFDALEFRARWRLVVEGARAKIEECRARRTRSRRTVQGTFSTAPPFGDESTRGLIVEAWGVLADVQAAEEQGRHLCHALEAANEAGQTRQVAALAERVDECWAQVRELREQQAEILRHAERAYQDDAAAGFASAIWPSIQLRSTKRGATLSRFTEDGERGVLMWGGR